MTSKVFELREMLEANSQNIRNCLERIESGERAKKEVEEYLGLEKEIMRRLQAEGGLSQQEDKKAAGVEYTLRRNTPYRREYAVTANPDDLDGEELAELIYGPNFGATLHGNTLTILTD